MSLASILRAHPSRICMKVIAFLLDVAPLALTKSMKMSPRSKKSQKTIGWNHWVVVRTILTSLSNDICKMKRARLVLAREKRQKKRRMPCLPRPKNC